MHLLDKNHGWLQGEALGYFVIVESIIWQHWHIKPATCLCDAIELNNAALCARINAYYPNNIPLFLR
jgi:hypothetical protein